MANVECEVYLLSFIVFLANLGVGETKEFCENYVCEEGHCCGHEQCCTYYYELWWFWLIWFIVAAMCICCFYQQKRIRRRRRQQNSSRQNANRIAPPILEPGKFFKLPTYDEVSTQPKDPPTYNVLYFTNLQQSEVGCPQGSDTTGQTHPNSQRNIDESVSACLLENEHSQDVHDVAPPLYNGQLFSSTESMPPTPPPYSEQSQQHYTYPATRSNNSSSSSSNITGNSNDSSVV